MNATNTLDQLFDFLENWYGPRRPEYGISEPVLAAIEMPEALRRLHGFAGAWPNPHNPRRGLFCVLNCLLDPAGYEPDSRGEIVFASENHDEHLARTDPAAEHPGVRGQEDECGDDPSLEDWLVRFCMRETVLNSPWTERPQIDDELVERIAHLEPLMDARSYPFHDPMPLWLVDPGVLVMQHIGWDGTVNHFFGAKDLSVIAALHTRHGVKRYSALRIVFGGTHDFAYWSVAILPDGSCQFGSEEVSSPAGVFNFDDLADRLDRAKGVDQDLWPANHVAEARPSIVKRAGRNDESDTCSPAVLREIALPAIEAIAHANQDWIAPWGAAVPQLIAREHELVAITIAFGKSAVVGRPAYWTLVVEPDGSATLTASIFERSPERAIIAPGSVDFVGLAGRVANAYQEPHESQSPRQYRGLRTVLHSWPPPAAAALPPSFYEEVFRTALSLGERSESFDHLLEEHPPEFLVT